MELALGTVKLLKQEAHVLVLICSQPLDRDGPYGQSRWLLRVTASDGSREAHTRVLINLKDVNDNPPRFPTPVVTAAVPENTLDGEMSIYEYEIVIVEVNFLWKQYYAIIIHRNKTKYKTKLKSFKGQWNPICYGCYFTVININMSSIFLRFICRNSYKSFIIKFC